MRARVSVVMWYAATSSLACTFQSEIATKRVECVEQQQYVFAPDEQRKSAWLSRADAFAVDRGGSSYVVLQADNNFYYDTHTLGLLDLGDKTPIEMNAHTNLVFKIDANGQYVWHQFVGNGSSSSDDTTIVRMATDNDGNVALMISSGIDFTIAGEPIKDPQNWWIVTLDASGKYLWKMALDGRSYPYSNMVFDSDGYVAVVVYREPAQHVLLRIREDAISYGPELPPATGLDLVLAAGKNGDVFVTGEISAQAPSHGTFESSFVGKMEKGGAPMSMITIDGPGTDRCESLAVNERGDVVVACLRADTADVIASATKFESSTERDPYLLKLFESSTERDPYLLKFNANLALQWAAQTRKGSQRLEVASYSSEEFVVTQYYDSAVLFDRIDSNGKTVSRSGLFGIPDLWRSVVRVSGQHAFFWGPFFGTVDLGCGPIRDAADGGDFVLAKLAL